MRNDPRWALGIGLGLLALLGLVIASRGGGTLYWTGLVFALIGTAGIFALIRAAFDEAEGKVRRRYEIVPLALLLVALGSVLFHVASPWWWAPIASNWQYIDDTVSLTFWITGLVFVAIVVFMAYCAYRFAHRRGKRAAYEPESRRLEIALTAITAVGVAAMLAPGLVVWRQFVEVPEAAAEIEAVGQQWSWNFRLPGEDGKLGRVDTRRIDPDNPLGLAPDDPAGQDDVILEGEPLHLPLGQPVKVLLRSADVLHSFYVPEFRTKMDLVPGMITHLWFTPTRTGRFQILCAELCGVAHADMRGSVVVVEEQDYVAWLRQQRTFAQLTAPAGEERLTSLTPEEEGNAVPRRSAPD